MLLCHNSLAPICDLFCWSNLMTAYGWSINVESWSKVASGHVCSLPCVACFSGCVSFRFSCHIFLVGFVSFGSSWLVGCVGGFTSALRRRFPVFLFHFLCLFVLVGIVAFQYFCTIFLFVSVNACFVSNNRWTFLYSFLCLFRWMRAETQSFG